MLPPPQQSTVEAQANLFENEQKQQLEQCLESKMNIILMATEIERLHKIFVSKKDYYEKKIQDLIDRELQDKEQIAKQAQAITELNQKILQKNDLITQILQEKSQQEMNLLISQQLFVINAQYKNAEIYIQELQKENQLLKQQFEDAPSLRQKLYDLEQWYAKLIHEKNEEINLLKNHQPHIIQHAPQLMIINQLLEQKERELLQWQYSSQQVNIYRENQRLVQELKFLNDKLNLLLFDNEHLKKRLVDIQSQPSNQTTQQQYATLRGDSQCTAPILHDFQNTKTPRRYIQQQQSIIPTDFTNTSLLSYRIIKRPQSVGSGSSIHILGYNPQIGYPQFQQSPRYSRKSLQNNSAQFNEILRQIQIIQNQPILTIQNIETQIQFLNHLLLIKRQELQSQQTPPRQIYPVLKTQGNERTSSPKYSPSQQIIMKQPINLLYQNIQPTQQQYIPQSVKLQNPNNIFKYRSSSAETKRDFSPNTIQYQQQLIQQQTSLFYNQPQQNNQIQYKCSPIQGSIPQQNLQNTIPRQTQRSVSPQPVQYMPYQTLSTQPPQTIRFQDLKQYHSVNTQPLQQYQNPQSQQNLVNYNLISQSQPSIPTQFGANSQNPSDQNKSPIQILAYPYDYSPQNPEDLNKTRQLQKPISYNPNGLFMTPNTVRKPVIPSSNSSQPFSQGRNPLKRELQEPLSIRKQKEPKHQSNKSLPAQILQSSPIDKSQVEPFELCNAPQEPEEQLKGPDEQLKQPDDQQKEPLKPEEIQQSPQLQDPAEQTKPKSDPQQQPIEQPKQDEQSQQPQNPDDQDKNPQNQDNLYKKPQKPYISLNKTQNPSTLSKPNQNSQLSSRQPIPQNLENQKKDTQQPENLKRSQPVSNRNSQDNKEVSLPQDPEEQRKNKQELDRIKDLLNQAKLENEKLKELYQQNDLNWQKQFQSKYTAALNQLQLFENKLAVQNREYNQNIEKQKNNFNQLQSKFDEQKKLIEKQDNEINQLKQNSDDKNKRVVQKEVQRDDLQKQLQDLQKQFADLQTKFKTQNDAQSQNLNKIAQQGENISNYEKQLKQQTQKYTELNAEYIQLKQKLDQLQKESTSSKQAQSKEINQYQQQITQLQQQINETTKQLKDKVNSLQSQLLSEQEQHLSLKKRYENFQRDFSLQKSQNIEIQNQNNTLRYLNFQKVSTHLKNQSQMLHNINKWILIYENSKIQVFDFIFSIIIGSSILFQTNIKYINQFLQFEFWNFKKLLYFLLLLQLIEKEQQLKELQIILNSKTQAIQQLEIQVKDTQAQTISTSQQAQSLNQIQVENLKKQLQSEQQKINVLNDQISQLQQQIFTLEQQLQARQQTNIQTTKEIQNTTTTVIKNSYQQENIQLQDENTDLQQKLKKLEQMLQKERENSNQSQQQIKEIQNKYKINQTKSSQENQEQLKNLKSQIEQLKLQNQNLSNQIIDMKSNYEMQISTTNTMTSPKVINLEKQLIFEKEQKEISATRILQLEKQLSDFQNIKSDQTEELRGKIILLENQILKLQKERDIIISSKQKGDEEIKILNIRISELSNRNNKNELDLVSLRSKYNNQIESTSNLTALNQQILILQQEKQSQINEMMLMRGQVEKNNQDHEYQLAKIRSGFNKDLENQQAINRKYQDEILNIKNVLQLEKRDREVVQKSKTQADERISQLNQEKQMIQDQLIKQKNQIEQLTLEINKYRSNQKSSNDEQSLLLQYNSCTKVLSEGYINITKVYQKGYINIKFV